MKIFSPVLKGTTTVSDGTTNLSGSFTGSLQGTAATASLANTASYVVSSQTDATQNTRLTTLESVTGSFTLTSSFGSYTASNDSQNTTQNARILSNEQKTGSFATTGSNAFNGSQTITGSLTATGTIVAQTLVVQTITSSVDFVTGSAKFGSTTDNTHQFTGSVLISGSQSITGGHTVSGDSLINTISYLGGQNTVQSTDKPHFFRINGGGLGISANNEGVDSQPIYFYTSGSQRLTITATGNVGIGTSSPNDQLEVAGNTASAFRIRINNANASGGETLIFTSGTTIKSWVEFNNSTSDFDVWQYTNNALRFGTNNTERMRITSAGSVGIGTTSPSAKLMVYGTGDLSYIYNSGASTTDANFYIYNSTKDIFMVRNSGNVGIGTANPSSKLHIEVAAESPASGSIALIARTSNGINDIFRWYDGATQLGVFKNSGLIGIGTTSPTYVLDVRQYSGQYWNGSAFTGTPTAIAMSNTVPGGYDSVFLLQQTDSGGTVKNSGAIGMVGTAAWTAGNNATQTSDMYFLVRNGSGGISERMRIKSDGNIGVGLSSLGGWDTTIRAIEIGSKGNFYGGYNGSASVIYLGANAYYNGGWKYATSNAYKAQLLDAGGGNWHFYNAAAGTADSAITWTSLFKIDTSGNIGIGITNPTAQLQVSSASGGLISINSTTTNSFRGITFQNNAASDSTEYAYIKYNATSGEMRYYANPAAFGGFTTFYSNNTESMRITSGGSVLIGQSTADLGANGWQLLGTGGGHTAFQITNNEAFIFNNRTGGTYFKVDFRTVGTSRGNIYVTDSSVAYNTSSDYRLKEDLQPINGLDKISQINVYNYKWKTLDERMDGVLAHELQEVIPYAVTGEKDGDAMQCVDYSKIVPTLIQSIKELKAEVDTLRAQIS